MNEFVVFYAWQSDLLERLNRHLIRAALDFAAQKISDDGRVDVRVRIDADTEGVLGHVPVTDTILKKIAACNAFVPDLTFVSETVSGKLVCNPNVMLEYGYALHAKSHSVMMAVMNTAYGPAEKLPFDMGHLRHLIKYELPATAKNAERRAVRKTLTEEFERILRLMMADTGSRSSATAPFPEASPTFSPAFFFPRGVSLAIFGEPGEQEYQFEGDGAIYLRLFPKFNDAQPRLGRVGLRTLAHNRRAINAMATSPRAGMAAPNDYGFVVIEPLAKTTTKGITQAFLTGELWGINSQVFQTVPIRPRFRGPDESATALGVFSVEKLYTRTLENYASVAGSEMKLRLPFVLEIGAVGLKGVYLGAPHPEFSQGNYYGPIREPSLIRRYELPDASRETLYGALRQFFNELYDLAECSRPDILTDEHIRRNDLPERR
jgi:hypothetical protein